jgi:phosphopantetheinyl transferase (holo-ACP synthase)
VGVDIERADRDFGSVSSRYMSEQEMQMSQDGLWAAKVWCAKEALYKLYGRRGVELREELIIESYDEGSQQLRARMVGQAAAVVDLELRGDNIIVAMAYFE